MSSSGRRLRARKVIIIRRIRNVLIFISRSVRVKLAYCEKKDLSLLVVFLLGIRNKKRVTK